MKEYDRSKNNDHIQRTMDRISTIRRMEEDDDEQEESIQKKSSLEIGAPTDRYEQEADAVAKKVTEGNATDNPFSFSNAPSTVQSKQEEPGTLMAKSEAGQLHGTEQLQSTLNSTKGGGATLDAQTQSEMGTKMGADLGDVKIHTDSKASEMAEGINAKAFTHGQDIYFKKGNYDTSSSEGKGLLAHELAHTQQQKNGLQRMVQRQETEPDKVSDYNESPSYEVKRERADVQGRSYYEGLVKQYFSVFYDTADKDEQAAVYRKVWENSPKADGAPFISADFSVQFGITLLKGGTVYYNVMYQARKTNEGLYYLNIDFATSDKEKAHTTSETVSFTEIWLTDDVMAKGKTAGELKYDNSFPPVPEGEIADNRQNAFLKNKNNSEAKSAIFSYANKVANDAYYHNLSIDRDIKKANKKMTEAKDENEKSSAKATYDTENAIAEAGYKYPFKGNVSGGGHSFFVEVIFQRAGNDDKSIRALFFNIMYLGGQKDAGIKLTKEEAADNKKTFADGEIDAFFITNKDNHQHPNFIGLDTIDDPAERELVKQFAFQKVYKMGMKDTHFDQVLTIDGEGIVYSFTVEKEKDPATVPADVRMDLPKDNKQLNIYIKRIGKIGEKGIDDPEMLRINDVPGYSDAFTDGEFVTFVTGRYKAIKAEDIKGATKQDKIDSVNAILREKARTADWYSTNYGVTIMNDMGILKDELKKELKFYIKGENEVDKPRAKVKGKSAQQPGTETEDPLGPNVQLIEDEAEGIKPWLAEELPYLEMSLQKMSPLLLGSVSGIKYFRQGYDHTPRYYNKLGGKTFNPQKYIVIYDGTFFNSSRVIGGEKDLSSSKVSTITHETGHVIQHKETLIKNAQKQKMTNGELFNTFYKSIGASGPTAYSRSYEISKPESEFFPEAFTLFLHDPEFLHRNFPKIYMWFYFLQIKGTAPSEAVSSGFVSRWNIFVSANAKDPDMETTHKIVFNVK